MALEGNLKDFSLADMFRLLASGSQVRAAARLQRRRGEGLVCFKDGEVFFASSGDTGEAVGKRLVSAGVISAKQLRQASGLMKIQKKDKAGRKLGQILIDEGYLDADVLENVLREQIADALFDLLRLGRRRAALRVGRDLCRGRPRPVGLKWRRRWPMPRSGFKCGAASGRRFRRVTRVSRWPRNRASKPVDIHLKPREWMLLCYLHDGRSVDELVEQTGYNDFETTRTLYGMYAEGLIVKVGPAGETLTD